VTSILIADHFTISRKLQGPSEIVNFKCLVTRVLSRIITN